MASVFAGFGDNSAVANIQFLEISILEAKENMEIFEVKKQSNQYAGQVQQDS